MATTGYFDGSQSSRGWYARLEYSYTQSTSATTITLTLKVYDATGYSENGYPNEAYYIIQGSKTYQTYSFDSVGWYTIASKTVSVTDTSATSLAVSATWCSENESSWTPYSLSVSGTITFPQIQPPVITITTSSIPSLITGYDGDSFSLSTTPSGGTSYTYKWYRNGEQIGTSQTLSGTMTHDGFDNSYVYCLVTDASGSTATTNRCSFRVGTSESQTQVSTKQIQPVKIYNGSKTLNGIPFVKTDGGIMYCSWTIQRDNTNVAGLAVVGKAIVG